MKNIQTNNGLNTTTYGLVLSGGGVRGMAHVGVIKALEEHGIRPAVISGASAGAIVGAFYAAGYSCEEIMQFFHNTSMFSFDKYTYRKPGLLDSDKFYNIFKTYFPDDSFEALEKSLFISATDILAGKPKFFHEGPLIHAILASAAFPVVLSPLMIDGILYADGGITNNFPTEPLLAHCDKIIGVYANPLKKIVPEDLTSSMSVLERAFNIGMATLSVHKFSQCDLLISTEKLNNFSTFGMSHLDEAYEIGYESAIAQLQQITEEL